MDVLPHGCAADPRGCGVCRLWLTFLNASSLINCKSLEQIPKGYEDSVLIALRNQAMWNVVPVPVPTSNGRMLWFLYGLAGARSQASREGFQ